MRIMAPEVRHGHLWRVEGGSQGWSKNQISNDCPTNFFVMNIRTGVPRKCALPPSSRTLQRKLVVN